jgi:ABC-2 type transport system ATP-binding protein
MAREAEMLSVPVTNSEDLTCAADMASAVEVRRVSFHYGNRTALMGVDFAVESGEIFGLLGPNGGGKTTLFRLIATLLPLQQGDVRVLGCDVASQAQKVRRRIGVTFQSPSIDGKLTVGENLRHQAHLYGLLGRDASRRIDELIGQLGLADRVGQLAGSLSGGLKRRVEIAKSLLHRPGLLLLDEPSTGLDPGARHDLWEYLTGLRVERHVTILVTTHLMDEAERCDRLGILDRGRLVALGTPDELRQSVGGDCLTIQSGNPDELSRQIASRFGVASRRVGDALRIEREAGHELLRDLVAAFPAEITAISLAKPTLEDVFIARTGHRFWDAEAGGKP